MTAFRAPSSEPAGQAPDIAVAPPRPSWWLVGMVVVSTLALIATTDDSTTVSFATSIDGPQANLTADTPTARYLVHVHVNALGLDNSDSTQYVYASVTGKITPSQAFDGGSPFVAVRLSDHDDFRIDEPVVSAVTDFNMGRQLRFTGKCLPPTDASAPCDAEFDVSLQRSDFGAQSGALLVDWQVDFNAQANKGQGPNEGPVVPPWTIDVTPL